MDATMLRPGSPQAMIELIRRVLLEVNTAIPGEVISYNPAIQTITAKPCIRGTTITNAGSPVYVDLPQIIEVPVFFPFSTESRFSLTYPIMPKDQCLLVFSQRSFDNWLKNGSVQNPSEAMKPRSHQYPDAIAFVGLIPNPKAIQSFQMNGIEIRNGNRNSLVKVMDEEIRIHEGCADVVVKADGSTEVSIRPAPNPEDGLQPASGTTYIQILPSGVVNMVTPNALNVQSAMSTFDGNMTITGNLVVRGNTDSKTYSVDGTAGASGSSDVPTFKAGLVIG